MQEEARNKIAEQDRKIGIYGSMVGVGLGLSGWGFGALLMGALHPEFPWAVGVACAAASFTITLLYSLVCWFLWNVQWLPSRLYWGITLLSAGGSGLVGLGVLSTLGDPGARKMVAGSSSDPLHFWIAFPVVFVIGMVLSLKGFLEFRNQRGN